MNAPAQCTSTQVAMFSHPGVRFILFGRLYLPRSVCACLCVRAQALSRLHEFGQMIQQISQAKDPFMTALPGACVISLPHSIHPSSITKHHHADPPPLPHTHSLSLADVTLTQFMSAVIWRSAYFLLHLMQFYRLFRYKSCNYCVLSWLSPS